MPTRPLKNLWKAYVESLDPVAAARECHPLSVAIIVGVMVSTALVARYVPSVHKLTQFHDPALPVTLALLGGACSLGTWWLRGGSAYRIAFLQFLDVAFYGMVPVVMAVLSAPPAAHVFAALYFVMLLRWGLFYSLTLIGTVSAVAGPIAFCGALQTDVLTWMIVLIADLVYVNTALNTRRRRAETLRNSRSEDIIKKIDALLLERHEAASAELKTSMAVLMHKLKNDLGPVMWNLDFIHENGGLRPDADQSLSDAIATLNQATETAQSFLRDIRVESANPRTFWLTELAQSYSQPDLQKTLQPRVVCMDIPNVLVCGSREYLDLALLNLLENAKQAGATRVTLRGEVQFGGTKVSLKLADNGPGLPQTVRERLFLPFNTYGKSNSTGVGMYLSRRMIETTGGTLTLESSGPEGTCFEIVLPIGSTRGSTPPAPILRAECTDSGDGKP